MGVLSLPVIPESYRPILRSADDILPYWKSIESGRARWVARWRRRLAQQLREDIEAAASAMARSVSQGHAIVMAEQRLGARRVAWETLLYRLYGTVAQDFASRFRLGLKAQLVDEKATPDPLAALGAVLEDRWLNVVADWLAASAGTRITQINAGTLSLIRAALQKGAVEGESIPKIARRLREAAPGMSRARAVTIARTEIIPASNLGARAGAIDTGLELDHIWIATPGRRTRPAHANANGQVQDMNVPFAVMGELLLFPGDSSLGATARNRVNCRCTVAYQPKSST